MIKESGKVQKKSIVKKNSQLSNNKEISSLKK